MLKNMRVFIAFRVFLYPGRKVATSFANITGITTRTRKLVNYQTIKLVFTSFKIKNMFSVKDRTPVALKSMVA